VNAWIKKDGEASVAQWGSETVLSYTPSWRSVKRSPTPSITCRFMSGRRSENWPATRLSAGAAPARC